MLGLLCAAAYLRLGRAGQGGLEADIELAFAWGIVGCFLGAKLLYLLTSLPAIARDLHLLASEPELFIDRYLLGGFVFYGGLYGCLGAVFIYCRAEKVDFYMLLERMLPVIPLVHGFGRIGCFCMGCCYGVESETFGIAFNESPVAPNGAHLFPVQLIEAACVFAMFFMLDSMGRRHTGGRTMLALYLISYSLLRFALEFLRGDAYRGFILGLSTSQLIALLTIAAVSVAAYRHRRRAA